MSIPSSSISADNDKKSNLSPENDSDFELSDDDLNEQPKNTLSKENENISKNIIEHLHESKNDILSIENDEHMETGLIIENMKTAIQQFFTPGKIIASQIDLATEFMFLTENDNKEVVTNNMNSDTFHDHFPSLCFTILNYYKSVQKKEANNNINIRAITFNSIDNKLTAFTDNAGFIRIFNNSQNKMDVVPSRSNIHGQPTALQFSIDMSYLFVGYSSGDIRIFECAKYLQIILVTNIFEKAISYIIPIAKNEFLISDSFGNAFCIQIKRGYIVGDSVEYERIDQLKGQTLSFIETTSYFYDPLLPNSLFLALIGLKSNNTVNIIEFRGNKRNLVEVLRSEDSFQIQSGVFNLQKYTSSQRIVFSIVTAQNLVLYELTKKNVGITKEEIKFGSKKLINLRLPDLTLNRFDWLNEFTFAMFTENCTDIYLVNFSLLLNSKKSPESITDINNPQKNNNFDQQSSSKDITKKSDKLFKINENNSQNKLYQIERDFLPDTAHFTMTKSEFTDGSLIKVWEKNQNPKSLSFLDPKGIVLTISLRHWRKALDVDLAENNDDGFFKNFLKVLYGKYTFFIDFVFETEKRKVIMNGYFCEKLRSLFEKKFYSIAKNLVYIFDALIEMNSYEFLLYNLKNEFDLRGETASFENVLESSILLNRIQKMPANFIQEICQMLLKNQKKLLINSIILKMENFDNYSEFLADFCLFNELYTAFLFIRTAKFSDTFEETLQILIGKCRNEMRETSNIDKHFNKNTNKADLNSPGQVLLWFAYSFLKKEFFARTYEIEEFKSFLSQLYITFSNPANARVYFEFSWRESLKVFQLFFSDDIYFILVESHFLTYELWFGFVNTFSDIFSPLNSELRDFCEFFLTLKYSLASKKPPDDPEVVLKKIVEFTKLTKFLFMDFVKLVEEFVFTFKNHFSDVFRLQFTDLMIGNYKYMPNNLLLLETLLNILIDLERFDCFFRTIGFVPRKIVKSFIFDYLENRIDDQLIADRFLVEIKYFLLMNPSKTFHILKKMGPNLKLYEIDASLSAFPSHKLDLYQHLLQHKREEATEEREFIRNYFILLVDSASSKTFSFSKELLVVDFLEQNFRKLDFWKSYRILREEQLLFAVAFLFEKANNLEKSFEFYFYALEKSHLSDREDETERIAKTLLDFLDKNISIIHSGMLVLESDENEKQHLYRFSNFIKIEHFTNLSDSLIFDEETKKNQQQDNFMIKSSDSLGENNLQQILTANTKPKEWKEDKKLYNSGFPIEQNSMKSFLNKSQKEISPVNTIHRKNSRNSSCEKKSPKIRMFHENEYIVKKPKPSEEQSIFNFKKSNNKNFKKPVLIDKEELTQKLINELKNLKIYVPDVLNFCRKKHEKCQIFKQKIIGHLFKVASQANLFTKLQNLEEIKDKLIIDSLKVHFDFEVHFSNILRIFEYQFSKEMKSIRVGIRFSEKCSVCKKNMLIAEELDSQIVIAKPDCYHIFHKECYLKKFAIVEDDIQHDVFSKCLLCEKEKEQLRIEDARLNHKGKIGGLAFNNVMSPIGNVIWSTGAGIKSLFDGAFSFGEEPRRKNSLKGKDVTYLRKKSLQILRRQSTRRISRISIKMDQGKMSPLDIWLSNTTEKEIKQRFDTIMNDDLFKQTYVY